MNITSPRVATALESPAVDFCELGQLAQRVAPELFAGDRTVHIVQPDDLPPDIPTRSSLGWAYDGKTFSPSLYHHFGDSYPVIVLNIEAIVERAESPQTIHGCVQSVLLHELAHVVPVGVPAQYTPERDKPASREFEKIRMQQCLATERQPWNDRGHDCRFALRCCCLYLRSLMAGHDIPVDRLFRRDFQTSEVQYIHAMLGDGLRRLDDAFSEIEDAPVPERFQLLWDADMAWMKERNETLERYEARHGS